MKETEALLATVRQNYVSVVWSHKCQEKQAEIYSMEYRIMETFNIVSAAITSCGVISLFSNNNVIVKIVTAVFSFISIAIAAFYKSFDLRTLEKNSKDAANRFLIERNNMLVLISDIKSGCKQFEELRAEYDMIINNTNALYLNAPFTSPRAYKKATDALKDNKEYTFSDAEIDAFLPKTLR